MGIFRGARTGTLLKKCKAQNTEATFKKTPVAVKMAKYTARKALTDFQRFEVMVMRKARSYKSTHLNAKPSATHKKKGEPAKAPPKEVASPASPGGKKGSKGAK